MLGHPVALSPQWLEIIREKGLSDGDFRNLSLLMSLYAHRSDTTGQCNPSIDRLAIMLGMGKSGVSEGIKNLQALGWLTSRKIPTANRREKYEYTLASYSHDRGALIFSSVLLTNGLWAFLTPAERKVWLKLRAHSIHGANVVPDAFCGAEDGCSPSEDVLDSLSDGWHWSHFWFVPEYVLAPEAWAGQLSMSRRTFTDAIKGLARLHMLTPTATVCEEGELGFVLMVDPQPPDTREWREHLNSFQARLSAPKRQQGSLAAKRLVTAIKKQQIKQFAQPEPIKCSKEN